MLAIGMRSASLVLLIVGSVLVFVPCALGSNTSQFDEIIAEYGYGEITEYIVDVQRWITIQVGREFKTFLGMPDLKYVNKQTILVDLQRMGRSPEELKELLSKRREIREARRRKAFSPPSGPAKVPHEPPASFIRAVPWPNWRGERPAMPNAISTKFIEAAEIFERVSPSVYILVAGKTPEGIANREEEILQGSAVAVSDRHLITNCHVVTDHRAIFLLREDSITRARLILAHPDTDRCFLEAMDERVFPVRGIRCYDQLAVGERVYSIGSPAGLGNTLSEGLISGLRSSKGQRLIQTSAPISSGSSGGGLFDRYGNLIGITTFLLRDAQNLNFAIATEEFWR